MKRLNFFLFLFSTILPCFSCFAEESNSHIAASTLIILLNEVSTLTANFKQEIIEGNKVVQTSYGEVFLMRQNKFRWFSKKPLKQLIVSNGQVIWVYDEDLEQVTINSMDKNNQSTPIFLLSSYQSTLDKNYNVSVQNNNKDMQSYLLVPKVNIDSSYVWLKLIYHNKLLSQIILKDKFEQLTKVYLSKVSLNTKLSQNLFSFVPPKGVDIVR